MDKTSNNDRPNLNPDELAVLGPVEMANHCAERAFWHMKGVDKDTAERLGVADMIQSVLLLLQKVDNITMDISIKIIQKQ